MGIFGAIFGGIAQIASAGINLAIAKEQRAGIEEKALSDDRIGYNNLLMTAENQRAQAQRNQALVVGGVVAAGVAVAIAYAIWSPHRLPRRGSDGRWE